MNYRELNATDLVKKWKTLVNQNVMMGRDSHMIKEALNIYTPVQILEVIYYYQGKPTVTIPMMLRNIDDLVTEDNNWAEVELARLVSNTTPNEYYIFKDNIDSGRPEYYQLALECERHLFQWADGVLS